MAAVHGKAEVIIGKHRHGPTSIVELFFQPELPRFSCLQGAMARPKVRALG